MTNINEQYFDNIKTNKNDLTSEQKSLESYQYNVRFKNVGYCWGGSEKHLRNMLLRLFRLFNSLNELSDYRFVLYGLSTQDGDCDIEVKNQSDIENVLDRLYVFYESVRDAEASRRTGGKSMVMYLIVDIGLFFDVHNDSKRISYESFKNVMHSTAKICVDFYANTDKLDKIVMNGDICDRLNDVKYHFQWKDMSYNMKKIYDELYDIGDDNDTILPPPVKVSYSGGVSLSKKYKDKISKFKVGHILYVDMNGEFTAKSEIDGIHLQPIGVCVMPSTETKGDFAYFTALRYLSLFSPETGDKKNISPIPWGSETGFEEIQSGWYDSGEDVLRKLYEVMDLIFLSSPFVSKEKDVRSFNLLQCLYRFHPYGTKCGDWFIPSADEYKWAICDTRRRNRINAGIESAGGVKYEDTFTHDRKRFWTLTNNGETCMYVGDYDSVFSIRVDKDMTFPYGVAWLRVNG